MFLLTTTIVLMGIFGSYYYDPTNFWYDQLNQLLTNRPMLGRMYIDYYGITLGPKFTPNILPLGWFSEHQLFNDNNYLKIFLSQGVILASTVFIYLISKSYKYRFTLYNASLILISLLFLVVEAMGFNVFLFTPLLFAYMQSDQSELSR